MGLNLLAGQLWQRWRALFAAVVVLLVMWLGFYFSTPSVEKDVVRLPLVVDCPLHLQPCRATLPDGGEVLFEMSPKNPSPTESILLTAKFSGLKPERVEVLFEGKEMYMGFLQYELTAGMDRVTFKGEGGLSVCIRSLMEWIALLEIELEDKIYELPFEFETVHLD